LSGNKLPGVLAEVEAAVGREAALKLALRLGGRDIHVPSPDYLLSHPGHPLARALSPETAVTLAATLGSGSVYVPWARRHLVLHLAGAGQSTREIAARLRVSVATVRRYKRGCATA